jgi:hypothetical protein
MSQRSFSRYLSSLTEKKKVDDGFRILEAGRVSMRDLEPGQRQIAIALPTTDATISFFCLFTVQDIPELNRFMRYEYDKSDIMKTRIQACEGKQKEWLLRINEDYEDVAKSKKIKDTSKKENFRGISCGNCRTCGKCTSVSYCCRDCQV